MRLHINMNIDGRIEYTVLSADDATALYDAGLKWCDGALTKRLGPFDPAAVYAPELAGIMPDEPAAPEPVQEPPAQKRRGRKPKGVDSGS